MKFFTTDIFTKNEDNFFNSVLFFSIFISPIIGGIKGFSVNLLWLLIPLSWGMVTKRWSQLGLNVHQFPPLKLLKLLSISFLGGILCGVFLLVINNRIPDFLYFLLILPSLHKQMTLGNPWILISLIPVAHFIHEIFYRGYIQSTLTLKFSSVIPSILFSSLLFAWTHVFIYSSLKEITLGYVICFVFIESIIGGYLFYVTKNLLSSVTFRSTNLIVISIILYKQKGLI